MCDVIFLDTMPGPSKAASAPPTKVPKSALAPVTVAPGGDSARAQPLFQGAAAAAVLEPLTTDAVVLREVAEAKRGSCSGGPLAVSRTLVKTHGQPAGAWLMSNGKAQSDVNGSGVAAIFATQHGSLAGWAKGQLERVVGEYKLADAASDIIEVRDAFAPGAFSADILRKTVRILGGR